jgi:glycosylphosphatidylinositol deacylase
MASVSLRMFKPTNHLNHFDYFMVDLNEEHSGLYGGVLHHQVTFVSFCINHILSLYHSTSFPPSSVLILGHSVGGIVAKALFSQPTFHLSLVNTIITLGTPNAAPVLSLDEHLASVTANAIRAIQSQDNLLVIALGGGVRDRQVRSGLTRLLNNTWRLSLVTTAMPNVWVTVDHHCLAWCRQMVINLNRALFELIDVKTHQLVSDVKRRFHHWKRWLVQPAFPNIPSYFNHASVVDIHDLPWSLSHNHYKLTLFRYALKKVSASNVIIVMTNTPLDSWLIGCSKSDQLPHVCHNASSLSYVTLPPTYGPVKMALLEPSIAIYYSDIGLLVAAAEKTKLGTPVFAKFITVKMQSVYYDINMPLFPLSLSQSIPTDKVFVIIRLHGFHRAWQAYRVVAKQTAGCYRNDGIPLLLQLHVPWYHEDSFSASGQDVVNLTLRLQSVRHLGSNQLAELRLYKDANCHVEIDINVHLMGVAGQLVRFYAPFLISLTVYSFLVKMAVSSILYQQEERVSLSVWWFGTALYILLVWLISDVFVIAMRHITMAPTIDWIDQPHNVVLSDITAPLLMFLSSVSWSLALLFEGVLSGMGFFIGKLGACCGHWTASRCWIPLGLSIVAICSCVAMYELAFLLCALMNFTWISLSKNQHCVPKTLSVLCLLVALMQVPGIVVKVLAGLWTWASPLDLTFYTVARVSASICLVMNRNVGCRKSHLFSVPFILGAMLIVLYCALSLHQTVIIVALVLLCIVQ